MPTHRLYPAAAALLALASQLLAADPPAAAKPAPAPATQPATPPPAPAAASPATGKAELDSLLAEVHESFHAIEPQDLEQARVGLRKDLKQLNVFLGRLPSVGPGWQKYLRLADLEAQSQPGVAPDSKLLASISARFAKDQPGLEVAPVRAVGDSLTGYIELVAAQGAENLDKQVGQDLDGLAEWLAKYKAAPTEQAAAEVSLRLARLRRLHQVPLLVKKIRGAYDRPNVFVAAKEPIVGAGIEQAIDDVTPLQDNILGTQITGTGRTVGRLQVDLVPDADHASFDTVLSGTTYSKTVGRNGPATIWAQGTTQISGRKRVIVDALGIRSLPATAAAVTKTQVTGVRAGRHSGGLIENIARRKVAEGQGQAEQVGSKHAEARIRARLESEVSRDLGRANRDFLEKFRNPLVRRHEFPALLQMSTQGDLLHLRVLEADPTQLAASAEPPALDEAAFDLAVRLHESAANNLAATVLAGVTLHDEEVRKKVIELRGSLPDELKDREDQDPWSITFEKVRPISLSIRDGGVEIVIRGQRYTTGENEKNKYDAMYVRASYKFEHGEKGLRWVRQGELDINPPTAGRQSAKVITLKSILKKKFAKLFPETVEAKGFELPGRWQKAGTLGLAHAQADNGWLALGWRRMAKPAVAKAAVAEMGSAGAANRMVSAGQ
jgi:hypothetical protein